MKQNTPKSFIKAVAWLTTLFLVGCSQSGADKETVLKHEAAPRTLEDSVDTWARMQQPAISATELSAPPVEQMIEGLEARLSNQPDDLKGWTLLAQSYGYVGRMSDARTAVDRAVALGAERSLLESKVREAHTGSE